jgi:YebC/PmpR family DNA-binding regulatory protein
MGRAFEKRKHTIFKRMDRVGKMFTKIGKEIAMAVKASGPSPEANPSLRRAIVNARAVNMPKDRIDAAIKKASGQGAAAYETVLYEGYGPHGIAMIVETATDNVTRTVANVRHAFKAFGGNMGTTGSVAFMFQKQGVFRLNPEGIDRDSLELELIDHGLIALEDGESEMWRPIPGQVVDKADRYGVAEGSGYGVTRIAWVARDPDGAWRVVELEDVDLGAP